MRLTRGNTTIGWTVSKLPSAPEAEQYILGAMLQSQKAINKALQKVKPKHFTLVKNRAVFKAIRNIYANDNPVEQQSVINYLKDKNFIDKAGGALYVIDLVDNTPSPASVDYYIEIVKEKFKAKKLIEFSQDCQQRLYKGEKPEDIANELSTFIMQMESGDEQKPYYSYNEAVKEAIGHIEKVYNTGESEGIKTGYVDFDDMTGGYQHGLHVLAARPSHGKTALSLNQTQHMAEQGVRVGYVSLETEKEWFVLRQLASEANFNSHKYNVGNITQSEFTHLIKTAEKIRKKYHIYIDDSFNGDEQTVVAKIRAMKKINDIDIAFIDYLQLMEGQDKRQNRNLEVGAMTRGLAKTAKKLKIPIVLLCQLNRSAEGKMPQKSHLRDSGEIEQNADSVTFLWRPEEDDMMVYDGEETKGVAWVKVDKWRNGRTGLFKLSWVPEHTRFENFTSREAGF